MPSEFLECLTFSKDAGRLGFKVRIQFQKDRCGHGEWDNVLDTKHSIYKTHIDYTYFWGNISVDKEILYVEFQNSIKNPEMRRVGIFRVPLAKGIASRWWIAQTSELLWDDH